MLIATQVGSDAPVPAGKMLEQVIPYEGGFWKAMQEQQQWRARRPGCATTQGDAMRQDGLAGFDHGMKWLGRRCADVG